MPTITIDKGNHLIVVRCEPVKEQEVIVQLLGLLRDWGSLELTGADFTITPIAEKGKRK